MENVFIHGSCVTRDIFRVMNQNYNFYFYTRSSIISLMSAPLAITPEDVERLSSPFQRKTVIEDFQKVFFSWFDGNRADIVILDLIDERLNVLEHDNSYVTQSVYMKDAGAMELYPFNLIPQKGDQRQQLWEDACERYIETLLQHVPEEKIVIHESYWATHYIDDDGEFHELEKQGLIKFNNEMLTQYYGYLKKSLPNSFVIQLDAIASPKHSWGLAPFHYVDEYYQEAYRQLLETGLITG